MNELLLRAAKHAADLQLAIARALGAPNEENKGTHERIAWKELAKVEELLPRAFMPLKKS